VLSSEKTKIIGRHRHLSKLQPIISSWQLVNKHAAQPQQSSQFNLKESRSTYSKL
jgi:hypothetical protein